MLLVVVALAAGAARAAAPPATPAGQQLAWVLATLNARTVPPVAKVTSHFAPAFRAAVSLDQLGSVLTQLRSDAPFRLDGLRGAQSPTALDGILVGASGTRLSLSIQVEPSPPHRISGLLFRPVTAGPPPPKSWRGVDRTLRGLAAHASLLAVEVRGGRLGRKVHALDPDRVGAVGSAFKLYVLGALASAVGAGRAAWSEELAIHDAWKSLPSGELRNEPAGERLTLRDYARQMISVSDNTAADHLIHRLGRGAVEAELARLGNREPARNEPLLTTREAFALKLAAPAALRTAYARTGPEERRRLLRRVDALALPKAAASWTRPRQIDSIEWFASPADLCRAQAALAELARKPKLRPLSAVLAANPGLALSKKRWSYVAFKGGSEPGVLSLSWLLRRHDGRVYAVAVVLDDPRPRDRRAGGGERRAGRDRAARARLAVRRPGTIAPPRRGGRDGARQEVRDRGAAQGR